MFILAMFHIIAITLLMFLMFMLMPVIALGPESLLPRCIFINLLNSTATFSSKHWLSLIMISL